MAFSLSKKEQTELANHSSTITEQRSKAEDAIRVYNDAIAAAHSALAEVLEGYNGALEAARSFLEDVHSEADSAFSDKSDKWQEGERGEATRTWIDAIEEAKDAMDPIELDEPEALDESEVLGEDHSTAIDDIQATPEY